MPLDLPEPDGSLLPSSPLDLVVCQIQFEEKPEIATAPVGLAIHSALDGGDFAYPRLDQIRGQGVNVEFGAQGPSVRQNDGDAGWRFQSSDGFWIVAIRVDNISLEAKQYAGWADFRSRLHALVEVLDSQVAPAIEQRTGLRYVDRISEVDARTPADWVPYLQEPILGFAAHEVLGRHLAYARQQALFDLGEGYGCTLGHGYLPRDDGRLDYLLDYDVFREGGRPFGVESLTESLEILHSDAAKLFHASIRPDLREIFSQKP